MGSEMRTGLSKISPLNLILQATNGFTPDNIGKCIERGVTRINANKLILHENNDYIAHSMSKLPLTKMIEELCQDRFKN